MSIGEPSKSHYGGSGVIKKLGKSVSVVLEGVHLFNDDVLSPLFVVVHIAPILIVKT